LNEDRTILVHLPEGYSVSRSSYPVLYVLDADWEVLFAHAATTAAYLNEFGLIPKVIVVGIINTVRNRDMIPVKLADRPHSGGSDRFLGFITKELMPHVKDTYRTEPYRILYGGSNAGLFALYAFLEEPQELDASIASSPMIGHCRDEIYRRTEAMFERKGRSGGYLYMIYGEDDFPKVVDFVPDYHRFLETKDPSFSHETQILADEGHVPFTSLYSGLRFLFNDWRFPETRRDQATLEEMKNHYLKVAEKYGFNSNVPLELLIELGYRSIEQGEIAPAIEALGYATLSHPYSPDAFYYLGSAYEKDDNKPLAMENYQKALDVDPEYRMAAEKIEELKKD
jgi:hypothetical protein